MAADFNFSMSYSGQSITGRLIGIPLDANGNGTEVDPASILIFSAPAAVGLPASPTNPYVFVPYLFERSTLFSGTFSSTVPGVYGFQVSNYSIAISSQNLMMVEQSGDVSLLFNFGAVIGPKGGALASDGIMAEEDALWPAINTGVSFTLVLPGDVNGDNKVNGSDLATLLGSWGTSDVNADLNHNGTVDGEDLAVLLGGWTG